MANNLRDKAEQLAANYYFDRLRKDDDSLDPEVVDAIHAALVGVVEECAKVCDECFKSEHNKAPDDRIGDGSADTAYHLAAAIRALRQQEVEHG